MKDNTCICCGRIIPEGRQICLHCGDYDDMQTFRTSKIEENPTKKYFRIRDDCGWVHYIQTNRMDLTAATIALTVPHVRSATQITRQQFEEAKK